MSGRPKLLPSVLVALALSATGCGKFREISACRSVARDVNSALDEIEALSHAKPFDGPRVAKRYATLAQTLQPQSVGETALARAVRDYIAILQATDVTLRNHAEAVQPQHGKVAEPRRELERLVKREHAAVVRIQVECQR